MKVLLHNWAAISLLIAIAFTAVTFAIVKPVLAQVDATSTDHLEISSTTPLGQSDVSASSSLMDATVTDESGTSSAPYAGAVEGAIPADVAPSEPPPQGLIEVHIIGTKYIDYFTNGTTVTAYPGDPAIDGNFDTPNAPIPTHEGLTWDHTTGGYLYDTPSGDLEVGEYAVQPSGSYITNAPPFVSSTSTSAVLGAATTSDPTDTIVPTTTSANSKTTSPNQ